MTKKDATWARVLGLSLAHLQHATDKAINYGFRKMRSAGKRKQEPETNKYLRAAKKLGRGTLRFFGSAGETYYEKYEDLKKES